MEGVLSAGDHSPAVVGVGIDVVDVERMARALERTPRLEARLFTDDERAYCGRADRAAERFAARFAAKEAVLKALGVGLGAADWHEIEVVRASSGRPSLRLSGRAERLANERGVTGWRISLSHTATIAQAIALAV